MRLCIKSFAMSNVTRIFDIPYYQATHFPLKTCFGHKKNGKWESISTEKYIKEFEALARGLIKLGIKPNDKIAVITSNNCPEWSILDIATLQVGAQNVPIYATSSSKDYAHILKHSDARFCFVSDKGLLEKVNAIRTETDLEEVYSFDEIEGVPYWKNLQIAEDATLQKMVEERKAAITKNDLASIIYTSGTTGKPKGVMLTHDNIVSNVMNSIDRIPLKAGKSIALSFLPICHIFERMISYLYQHFGISVYFAESLDKISDNMQEVSPEMMTAVPRLYEKIFQKIMAKGATLTGVKKALFDWSIALGKKYETKGKSTWYLLQLAIARKLVFSKWKNALGGNIKVLVSGGAALQEKIARMFFAAGIPLIEGYGLTETSPVIAVNNVVNGQYKPGTVGPVLKRVTVKIAEDGEILVKGPNIMKGYYKATEITAKVFKDGYFCTGDIGTITKENFLKITGRKKEIFKTSLGKYIRPTPLEDELKSIDIVNQAMVVGENEKIVGTIIEIDWDIAKNWAKEQGIKFTEKVDFINNKAVITYLKDAISVCNKMFSSWEQIKKFEISDIVWTVDAGLITPTLKLKRKQILKAHQKLYDKIYR